MIKTFIEMFDLPKDSEFKRTELEDALIKKFHDLHYSFYQGCTLNDGQVLESSYVLWVSSYWGDYKFDTHDIKSKTPTDALINFFLKYGKKELDINNIDLYYEDDIVEDLKEVVRDVYAKAS